MPRTLDARRRLGLWIGAVLWLSGCVEHGDGSYVPLRKDHANEWTPCARQGGLCRFSGTHEVRYIRPGRDPVVRTFTDGVLCIGLFFHTSSHHRGACEVRSIPRRDASTPPPPDGGTGFDAATDAGLEPDANADSGSGPDAASDAGTGLDAASDAGTGLDAASDAGPGPDAASDAGASDRTIRVDAIPDGSEGSGEFRVRSTSEVPYASNIGAFRTVCQYSHMNFDDPILFPGEPGRSHLHTYFGNTETDAFSTTESLRTSGNSTCRGGIANRSGYWVPAVMDAEGTPQAPHHLDVYYKSGYGGVAPEDIQPFPEGLRIIAGGNPEEPETLPSPHIYYGCQAEGYNPVTTIPDCAPGDLLIMVIRFPQCWDGVHLDSADHRSHMAYPSGGCPDTHPVPIPVITLRVHYEAPPEGTDGWWLSSDAPSVPGGLSLHADWFSGWDPYIVEEFVTNCNNASVDCRSHLLGPYREIY